MAQINEIFNISYGTGFNYNKMVHKDDGVAFVSRKSKNNGVVDFVDYYLDTEPIKAGNITVSLGGTYVLSAFVQLHDFYTAQNVAVLEPIDKDMSLNEKLYYCLCITANRHKYSAFGREANSTIKNLEVPNRSDIPKWVDEKELPDVSSIPDYFLEEGYDRACWYLDNIDSVKFEKQYKKRNSEVNVEKLDTDNWKKFEIGQLFEIYTGKDLILSKLNEGEFNVVSHSKQNNGVVKTTQELEGYKLFNCNKTISLADRGNFFATIQNEDFYIGTRVKALEAKFTDSNKFNLMFIAIIINQESFRFSYGNNCCSGINKLTIKLPALYNNEDNTFVLDKKGNFIPDYSFMERYIKSLNYSICISQEGNNEFEKNKLVLAVD